jgi:hypothetical protein
LNYFQEVSQHESTEGFEGTHTGGIFSVLVPSVVAVSFNPLPSKSTLADWKALTGLTPWEAEIGQGLFVSPK